MCGCRGPSTGIGWPQMNTSVDPDPSPPGPFGDESVLVSAMESAPAAIYFFASAGEAGWADARARSVGTNRSDFPVIDGRPVADLVDAVLRTGRSETVCGTLAGDGTTATAIEIG